MYFVSRDRRSAFWILIRMYVEVQMSIRLGMWFPTENIGCILADTMAWIDLKDY